MPFPVITPPAVVLVVEDEPLLRMAAVDVVEDAGFEALEAGTAAEAAQLLESRPDIRVVFTDIQMPGGMDGMGLVRWAWGRLPPMSFLIVSGAVRPDISAMGARAQFFAKPYDTAALTGALQQLAA